MDDLLLEFLTETNEHLETVDVEMVRFEQDPNNEAILSNIFRLVHTIKGTCGFLGLPRLEALAHAAETLMGKFRDGMAVTTPAVSLILTTLDRIKEILGELERQGAEPEGSDSDLIEMLEKMAARGDATARDTPAACQAAECRNDGLSGAGARAEARRGLSRRTRAGLPGGSRSDDGTDKRHADLSGARTAPEARRSVAGRTRAGFPRGARPGASRHREAHRQRSESRCRSDGLRCRRPRRMPRHPTRARAARRLPARSRPSASTWIRSST